MRSLIDISDFSKIELLSLIELAEDIAKNPARYSETCKGKKIATLFYEPSTRTRLSFEAAMLELGGAVLGFSDPGSSSVSKGESVFDTAKIVSSYADIIAMRHPYEGAPFVASVSARVPVINAGDGGHCHPTQTLADLLTIKREKGSIDGITIGFCGDLKFGRTVHSLLSALSMFDNIKVVLISPEELKLPDFCKHGILEKNGMEYTETTDLEGSLGALDILYMTRIQKERFDDVDMYERLKDSYVLTSEKMNLAKTDMRVLHPLPRVNEISVDVDDDPRACYFKQAENGKYMRKALILRLLSDEFKNSSNSHNLTVDNNYVCSNPKCITRIEQEIKNYFIKDDNNNVKCAYCEVGACKKED